jgi:hypothetical protein
LGFVPLPNLLVCHFCAISETQQNDLEAWPPSCRYGSSAYSPFFRFVPKKNKHREDKYKHLIFLLLFHRPNVKPLKLSICQIDKSIVFLYTLAVINPKKGNIDVGVCRLANG